MPRHVLTHPATRRGPKNDVSKHDVRHTDASVNVRGEQAEGASKHDSLRKRWRVIASSLTMASNYEHITEPYSHSR